MSSFADAHWAHAFASALAGRRALASDSSLRVSQDASGVEAKAHAETPATETKVLTRACARGSARRRCQPCTDARCARSRGVIRCDPVAQELTKAERKALFEQQNKAKIEAVKAAKEKEKLSKAERAAIQVSGFARDAFAWPNTSARLLVVHCALRFGPARLAAARLVGRSADVSASRPPIAANSALSRAEGTPARLAASASNYACASSDAAGMLARAGRWMHMRSDEDGILFPEHPCRACAPSALMRRGVSVSQ